MPVKRFISEKALNILPMYLDCVTITRTIHSNIQCTIGLDCVSTQIIERKPSSRFSNNKETNPKHQLLALSSLIRNIRPTLSTKIDQKTVVIAMILLASYAIFGLSPVQLKQQKKCGMSTVVFRLIIAVLMWAADRWFVRRFYCRLERAYNLPIQADLTKVWFAILQRLTVIWIASLFSSRTDRAEQFLALLVLYSFLQVKQVRRFVKVSFNVLCPQLHSSFVLYMKKEVLAVGSILETIGKIFNQSFGLALYLVPLGMVCLHYTFYCFKEPKQLKNLTRYLLTLLKVLTKEGIITFLPQWVWIIHLCCYLYCELSRYIYKMKKANKPSLTCISNRVLYIMLVTHGVLRISSYCMLIPTTWCFYVSYIMQRMVSILTLEQLSLKYFKNTSQNKRQ